jgi:glycosyltransferase involved in cell wall biosynthesis
VGRFDTPGGVDLLLRVYKKIKETRNDIELLLVGGYSYNECYNEAKNAGAYLVERIPEESLLDYYRAADVYALPIKEYLFRNFGGIGTATIQALACGLPVVSYNILNVPGSDDEIEKIGKIFDTDLELYNNILYILDNEGLYKDCREVAKKYYEKNTVIDSLLLKYKEIINQYYPEKGMQLSG